MYNYLIEVFAFILLFAACDVNRKEESKIELFSWNSLIQIVLISLAALLIDKF